MKTLKRFICAKLGIDWTSAPLGYSQTFRAAKTSGSTMGVYLYTTPARGSFKHRKTSRWCFCFSCDSRRMLHGQSCLLVYETAPASVAVR